MRQHQPRKRFGQNFLVDDGVLHQLLQAIAPQNSQVMLEIGPGRGALTQLLLPRVHQLHAVEIDRDLVAALSRHPDLEQLQLRQADALTVDFTIFPKPLRLVGNLPYNVATPILLRLFEISERLLDVHVMLQKEVADRLVAAPNTKAYGRLSVVVQYQFITEALFDVPPHAFFPEPQVMSAFVRLIPRRLTPEQQQRFPALSTLVQQAFAMRRKTLRNALRDVMTEADIRTTGVDPTVRPEALGIAAWVALTDQWRKAQR